MPYYICPHCKERTVDIDAREGFSTDAPACRHCGFGFLFELLDDYYPAPDTGLLVTDKDRRVLAIGRPLGMLRACSRTTVISCVVANVVVSVGP